jgi:hypothetical protein
MTGRAKRSVDVVALRRDIAALIGTGIFASDTAASILFQAAYMWAIVNVHDLLKATSVEGEPLKVPNSDVDVVDLIGRARYNLVHAGGAYVTRGDEAGGRIQFGPASGYPDDIAVEIAGVRVLIRRHLVDAFEEACRRLDVQQRKVSDRYNL